MAAIIITDGYDGLLLWLLAVMLLLTYDSWWLLIMINIYDTIFNMFT